jgi:hypothetical protein
MYSLNKISSWLDAKTAEEKNDLFKMTKKKTGQVRREFRARQEAINRIRRAEAEEAIAKAAEMQKKKEKIRENLSSEIQEFGFWTDSEDIVKKLDEIPKVADKMKALKSQLKYRQTIIQQEAPKDLFAFSHVVNGRRVQLKWKDLAENLMSLIRISEGYPPCWLQLTYPGLSVVEQEANLIHVFFQIYNIQSSLIVVIQFLSFHCRL